ncbi:hypothetical protein BCR42DRAFT_417055 [Absidia repens]|uniref:Uncharacterized protein n=1 Tax=Absidia repens TaxID=90262 RepID=A0A1X2IDB5_9FUNG|nr:hypothetical protein BCR42DRAFT_417055 [Absidia repens]
MDYFPSPPSSPTPSTFDKVMCGECEKPLSSDWFCSDCHKRCDICNRFLTNEQCSRCWVYDEYQHSYVRKPRYFYQPPPPTSASIFFNHSMPQSYPHYFHQQQQQQYYQHHYLQQEHNLPYQPYPPSPSYSFQP